MEGDKVFKDKVAPRKDRECFVFDDELYRAAKEANNMNTLEEKIKEICNLGLTLGTCAFVEGCHENDEFKNELKALIQSEYNKGFIDGLNTADRQREEME